jgi:opacity protein-like surface antigen
MINPKENNVPSFQVRQGIKQERINMKRLGKLVLMLIAILLAGMGSAIAADLTVTSITWNPAGDILAGQDVTLIAEIQNADTDTVTANFSVNFSVNGTSLGDVTVWNSEVPLGAGATITVGIDTQLSAGENVLTVVADSGNVVTVIV